MDNQELHKKVKDILYSLTGITLSENKDIMIANRLEKLKRNTDCKDCDLNELLNEIKDGKYITEFINTFTTNKTHFFREDFHFEDLRDRVLPEFANNGQEIKMYCSASSTGEEPYSMKMTVKEASTQAGKQIRSSIIATDIDTEVLQYAANGIYRFQKSSKEFPTWLSPAKYFKKRIQKGLAGDEVLIKVKDELKQGMTFSQMNLNDDVYPFDTQQFDVVFCRNVLIYFSMDDQNAILKKLFRLLKIGGTLYLGHSENPQDLINYTQRVGQNIFVKLKDFN
ncbi:MAG: methyltransferase domain-containing protein [Arcobacteraceae bacterium]|nr:methyltransferase domain-containing protein [Arcobacteraceae bacterium]